LRFKPLVIPIDERYKRNRHLKDARQLFRDAVENFFTRAIRQMQTCQLFEAVFLVVRDRAGDHLIGKRNGKLRELHNCLGEGHHHFVRTGRTQPFSRARHVFCRAPNSDHDLHVWQLGAKFRAEIARMDQGGGCDNRDANRFGVRLRSHLDELATA
jgi:hypothetical protein